MDSLHSEEIRDLCTLLANSGHQIGQYFNLRSLRARSLKINGQQITAADIDILASRSEGLHHTSDVRV